MFGSCHRNAQSRPARRADPKAKGAILDAINERFDRATFGVDGRPITTHLTVLHPTKGYRHISVKRLPRGAADLAPIAPAVQMPRASKVSRRYLPAGPDSREARRRRGADLETSS